MNNNFLYIIGTADEKHIKLGRTSNLERRLAEHAKDRELHAGYVLAVWRGLGSDESVAHRCLAHYKADDIEDYDELFKAEEPVKGWIVWLRDFSWVFAPNDFTALDTQSQEQLDDIVASARGMPLAPGVSDWCFSPERISSKRKPISDLAEIASSGRPAWSWLPIREATRDDWHTPEELIAPVREFLGGIDLDPASEHTANKTVQAHQFYTKWDDGLTSPWFGKVWLNPPFKGPPGTGEFIAAWMDKWNAGEFDEGVFLIATIQLTAIFGGYMREFLDACSTIFILTGRYEFGAPPGMKVKGLGNKYYGHVLCYFGPRPIEFAEALKELGVAKFS